MVVEEGRDGGAVQIGDAVTLLGSDGDDRILSEQLATRASTINYEIVTSISERVPRSYVGAVDGGS